MNFGENSTTEMHGFDSDLAKNKRSGELKCHNRIKRKKCSEKFLEMKKSNIHQ